MSEAEVNIEEEFLYRSENVGLMGEINDAREKCPLHKTNLFTLMKEYPHSFTVGCTEIGREHPGLKAITEALEDVQYKGREKSLINSFNPSCLLPDPMLRDYWTYEGSMTYPPCHENVTWIVFRYPLTLSHSQMEEFRRMRTHAKGETYSKSED